MPTGRERSYHHGGLRDALLESAEASLEANGPERISLRELGRALGVSHSAAQRHFADKRGLLDALAELGFRRLQATLEEAVADASGSFDARLKRLARAHLRFGLRSPALLRWMFDASARPDASAGLAAASEEACAPAFVVLSEGQTLGEVVEGDPEELGLVAFAAVQGLIALGAGGRSEQAAAEAVVDGVVHRLIVGLRPRP